MNDYKLESEMNDGSIKVTTYQRVLDLLDMQDDILHGSKLSVGGVPQVMSVCSILKATVSGVKQINIIFDGNCIATV
jgi:hypothetical protein